MKYKKWIIFDFAGTLVKMRPATLLINKNLLIALTSVYQLGIITGAKKTEVLNILKKLNLNYLFASILTKDDTTFRKPDPRLFSSKPLAYIGDGKKDEIMAKLAKVYFFRVNRQQSINQITKFLLKCNI